jgi:hypothetical protein
MWKKLGSVLLMVALLAGTATSATTGDPIDGNDRPVGVNASWEVECAKAALWPQCNWCVSNCIYAIMADMWSGGGIGWDWGAR